MKQPKAQLPLLSWILFGAALFAAIRLGAILLNANSFNVVRLLLNLCVIGALIIGGSLVARHSKGHSSRQHLTPILLLFVLAPWVGEFLLGNVPLGQLVSLPFLALLYGAGAVVIRETARQTGRGWPMIFLLAAAYGVIEAGLVDQSMFNQSFVELQDTSQSTYISALGINAYNTFAYVTGHIIWSIATPIAIAELWAGERRLKPWLSRAGLAAVGGVYLVGCAVIFGFVYSDKHFIAEPLQLVGAGLVAIGLIGLAFAMPKRTGKAKQKTGWVPRPWLAGIITFILASLFFIKSETWIGIYFSLALLTIAAVAITHFAHKQAWTSRHQLALITGALLTYAWGGFVLTLLLRPGNVVAWVGNGVFVVIAIALLVALRKRLVHSKELNTND